MAAAVRGWLACFLLRDLRLQMRVLRELVDELLGDLVGEVQLVELGRRHVTAQLEKTDTQVLLNLQGARRGFGRCAQSRVRAARAAHRLEHGESVRKLEHATWSQTQSLAGRTTMNGGEGGVIKQKSAHLSINIGFQGVGPPPRRRTRAARRA